MTTRIRTRSDVDEGVAALAKLCPHMEFMIGELEVPVPTRLRKPGFEALLHAIVSQQVSVASAASIWGRMEELVDPLTPENFLKKRDATMRKVGLSRPKEKYGRALSTALVTGTLNLKVLPRMADEEAMAHLCEVPGIGQWTAEIYLMFCLGKPDIFPGGDVALQNTYQKVAKLELRPTTKEMAEIAIRWSPWRSVAARVLWTYLRQMRMQEQSRNAETYP